MQRLPRFSTLLSKQPFSIYIHWPYCQSKCTYCNFNKYVNPTNPPHQRMESAICTELRHILGDPRYRLKGRPIWNCYVAINLESSAGYNRQRMRSVETRSLTHFRDVGINRLSLGIQSFNDKDLSLLGRDHSGEQAFRSLEEAKQVFNCGRVTFDLIFGRPGQSVRDWEDELERSLQIADDHISLYQLTIERSTPIYKAAQKGTLPPLPTSDEASDMYEASIKVSLT
ncbi:coproporphyrinogen III oxidase [Endogone sp. FLAS-F59071]|nr:coproporphyrinogen III oxidase [Endogone sp. FLAS-F59071]|eukprot:RUS22558.1 coproporphyrinogen III oxidase [Endogone sp. FLAS-F59071]